MRRRLRRRAARSRCAPASSRRADHPARQREVRGRAARGRRAAGARIVLDNFDELERLERIAAPCEVMMRVTPGVVADTHAAILTGHAGSKFGFSLADAPRAIERLRAPRWARPARACTSTSARSCSTSRPGARRSRRSPALGDFAAYDLGGGLAVAYTPDQPPAERRPSTSSAMVATADELLGPGKRALDRARPRARRPPPA